MRAFQQDGARTLAVSVLTVCIVLSGACAPAGSSRLNDSSGVAPPEAAPRQKSLTLGVTSSVKGLGMLNFGSAIGGTHVFTEVHSLGLVAVGDDTSYELRLGARLPSFEDGSIVVPPDGTMQTTWQLRPDARWHDGQPLTADDFVFASHVLLEPGMGLRTPNVAQLDHVEAIDDHTIRLFWKSTFYNALALGVTQFSPLPAHLLQDSYLSDKDKFRNSPYWTTEYVHLGPFRLTDFGLGESLVFDRFDAYFLGPPRLDRIRVQVIGDPNALYSQLLAGTVDVAPDRTLSDDQNLQLRRDWQANAGGRVFVDSSSIDFILIQFHPERAALPEIGRDPRLRLGLFVSLDRQTLRETIYPGFHTAADTFLSPSDPRLPIAGKPFARHRYDPDAAVRAFEDAGWRRDASGRFLRQNGEPVQLPLRGDGGRVTKLAMIADMWRRTGLTVNEEITPPALVLNREYRAHFPGIEWGARGGDTLLQYFLSSQFPTPENRYGGANRGSYSNPAFDRLTERLYTTVDQTEQAHLLTEVGEIWATDFPLFPLQYAVFFKAVRQGVYTAGQRNDRSWDTRCAHLWDRI